MLLRKLEMQGFKSFADKTEFVFDPGVTGIVGPNGCGKSNVVDAIKWALGEMSAKSLRGEELADVIFNGTETRPSVGCAEVSLTFSNEDGRLPIEYGEVTISRRLFRSGESEYLLNRQPCRLRDIRELFMDTGLGNDAYSIIEQGKIDVLLLSSPKERRAILEEAAGISKYKAKRRETQTKLERVTQDLLRVNDVVKELQSQIRSLKIQAGRALRYQQSSQEYREKKTQLSLHCYRELVGEGAGRVERLAALRARREEAVAAAAALDDEIRAVEGRVAALAAEHQAAQEALHAAEGQATQTRERGAGDRRYLAELADAGERRGKELEGLRARAAEARTKHAETAVLLEQVLRDLEQAGRDLDDRTATWQEVCRGATELADRLNQRKSESLEAVRKRSSYLNEATSVESERRRLEANQTRVRARDQEIAAEVGRLAAQEAEVGALRVRLEEELGRTKAEHHGNEDALTGLKARLETLSAEVVRLRELEGRKASRQEVLLDLERHQEGLGAGVKAVLEAAHDPAAGLTGVLGIVADLLVVDSAHVPVVDAVLNGRSQSLVTQTRADAVRALEFIRARGAGRIQVIPLEGVGAANAAANGAAAAGLAVDAAAGMTAAAGDGGDVRALCDGAEDGTPGGQTRPPERDVRADGAGGAGVAGAAPESAASQASVPEATRPQAAAPGASAPEVAQTEPPALGTKPSLAPADAAGSSLEKALFGGASFQSMTSLGTSPGVGGFGFIASLFSGDGLAAAAGERQRACASSPEPQAAPEPEPCEVVAHMPEALELPVSPPPAPAAPAFVALPCATSEAHRTEEPACPAHATQASDSPSPALGQDPAPAPRRGEGGGEEPVGDPAVGMEPTRHEPRTRTCIAAEIDSLAAQTGAALALIGELTSGIDAAARIGTPASTEAAPAPEAVAAELPPLALLPPVAELPPLAVLPPLAELPAIAELPALVALPPLTDFYSSAGPQAEPEPVTLAACPVADGAAAAIEPPPPAAAADAAAARATDAPLAATAPAVSPDFAPRAEPAPSHLARVWYSASAEPAPANDAATGAESEAEEPESLTVDLDAEVPDLPLSVDVLQVIGAVLDAWVAALDAERAAERAALDRATQLEPAPAASPAPEAPPSGAPAAPPAFDPDAFPSESWWTDVAAEVEETPDPLLAPSAPPAARAVPFGARFAADAEALPFADWWSDVPAPVEESVEPEIASAPADGRRPARPRIDPADLESLPAAGWWADAEPESDATPEPARRAPHVAPRRPLFESAARFVSTAPQLEPLAHFLLGRFAVADDLERALAARDTGAFPGPIVARTGELLESDGTLTGGAHEGGTSLLSRKAELRDLEKELEALRTELAGKEAERAATLARADELATQDKALLKRIYDVAHDFQDAKRELETLAKRRELLATEAEVNRLELADLGGQIDAFAQKEASIRKLVAELEAWERELAGEIEAVTARLRSAQEEKEALGQEVSDLKARTYQFAERRKGHEAALAQLEREAVQVADQVRSTEEALAENEARRTETQAAIAAGEEALQRLEAEVAAQRTRLAGIAEARAGAAQEAAARAEGRKEAQARIAAQDAEAHEIEKEEIAHQGRLDNLVGRMKDELGIDLPALLAATPADPPLAWDEITTELEELKRRLDAVGGGVNLAAIDELKAAEERFTFLSAQQQDLESSQGSLEDLMKKLNKDCRERFEETLAKVRENFSTLFRKLFGGGKADILLEQPPPPQEGQPAVEWDILESGIEIMAKPPGKEPTSISLLSGGEKALTTLALVMGIFQLKPSPFCVMDEVDAPLDESNIDRFIALVKEFAQCTQFLLITHNKKSMAASGVIYGVTQQEKGVSKKISVRLVEELEPALA